MTKNLGVGGGGGAAKPVRFLELQIMTFQEEYKLNNKKFTSGINTNYQQPKVERVPYLSPDGADNLDVCPLNVLLNTMVPVQ